MTKETKETLQLDYQEEQDKSVPLYKSLKQRLREDAIDYEEEVREQIQESLQNFQEVTQKQFSNRLIHYPPTNIHHFSKSPQTRNQAERMIQDLVKKGDKHQSRNKALGAWTATNENTFKQHKSDIRLRLAQRATTAPWDKVIMGSFLKMFLSCPTSQDEE